MASDARVENDGLRPARAPIGRRFSRALGRGWATERGRRRIIFLLGLVVVLVIIGLGVVMFSSLAGESQSYRDGYSSGGTAFGSYGSEGAQQACKTTELLKPGLGGRPSPDNSTQWLQGCLAGFNATQADG
jgi:hypothetical protein